jgi:hypothetical protein
VPLIIRYPGKVPAGKRVSGYNQHKDLVPTLLELAGSTRTIQVRRASLMPMVRGECASHETRVLHHRMHLDAQARLAHAAVEADRRAGAGFPLQARGRALQPGRGPDENTTWPRANPDVVAFLQGAHGRLDRQAREAETGLPNPIHHQGDWHGHEGVGAFKSSQQAYDTLHIGDPNAGRPAGGVAPIAARRKRRVFSSKKRPSIVEEIERMPLRRHCRWAISATPTPRCIRSIRCRDRGRVRYHRGSKAKAAAERYGCQGFYSVRGDAGQRPQIDAASM